MERHLSRPWWIVAAAVLAASLPVTAEGIDDLLNAELDKIAQKHKAAAANKAGPTATAGATRLRFPGETDSAFETPVLVEKPSPRQTLAASLASRVRVNVGPWYYVGPFANDKGKGLTQAYLPEAAIDLQAEYVAAGDARVSWTVWEKFREGGQGNSVRMGSRRGPGVGYAFRRFTAPKAVEVPICLDARDPAMVWLNGEKLLPAPAEAAKADLRDAKLWLKLKAGDNALLVKFASRNESLELRYGDHRSQGSAIEDMVLARVRRGLGEADARQLQDFELEQDWLRWDRAVLAKGGYRAAANQAMGLAERTLVYVESAAPRPKLAAELSGLQDKFASAGAEGDWQGLYFQARHLRRRIVLAHPLLQFERLLINKRTPPGYSHMCDQYLGRHSGAGDGLVILTNWRDAPRARPLLADKLPAGTTHHPDLSYDGLRVLFSFCDHTEPSRDKRRFWIYEATVDGRSVRQITGVPGRDPMEGQDGRKTVVIEDWDGCYLPCGDLVFISTRNQGYGRCHGGRYTPSYVLYRCGPNGENIRRISWGEANEWDPSVLHDGRVIYTRWDYINRHDTMYQSLWTTRPDGTATAHFYGNNTRNPCMIAEARAIPGSHRVVATAMAHHSYTSGSIMILDPLKGFDGMGPIERVTPEARFPETEGMPDRAFCTPWPLNEELFLTAYTHDRLVGQGGVQRPNAYGIYLVDTLGGRELICRDPEMSCFTPIPLEPRPAPPTIASAVKPQNADGLFFVHNVYASGDMGVGPISPGTAKYLRVVGIIGQPDARAPIRSRADNEVVKRIIGTVPLDATGSAAFRAPADEPLLLQVLDENHMSVMSMRSQAYVQPGESMSCVGCHEPAGTTTTPHTSRLEVRNITPAPGPRYEDGFSFARTVQPVLDRYCIGCHGLGARTAGPAPSAALAGAAQTSASAVAALKGKGAPGAPGQAGKAAGFSLLGTHSGSFSESYDSLMKHGGIRLAQRNGEAVPSRPKDYGALASKLGPMLLAGHKGRAKLDPDSLARIAGWLDLNVQYYGDYILRNRPERRRPDRDGEKALRAHIQSACGQCHQTMSAQPFAALVNIACPDESRVLKAPLPVADGGWGHCKAAFADPADPKYQTLREKVLAAAGPEEQNR